MDTCLILPFTPRQYANILCFLFFCLGPAYSGPLSHFLRQTREVVEDMEQPLDLSQRESTVERSQKVINIDMEEPICQYTNCSCPLKHILSLDKKEQPNTDSFRPRCDTICSGDYSRGPLQKRIQEQTENSQGHFHPKRRKMEQYKQSISRSSSDTNLHGYVGPTDHFRSSFTNYSGEDTSQRNITEGKYQSYWKPSQTYTATNTYPCVSEESSDAPGSEGKMVPKHIERLPKKRSHARNLSYDNSFQNSLHSGSEMKASRTPSPQTMSTDADMSRGENLAEEKKPPFDPSNLPELNVSPRTNGDELRASIMAELNNEKDDEDVNEFRKRFFGSLFSRAKGASKKGKPSALDILISNKCMDDFNFRPRNSHIDQIIRGEKSGKLCLMDIVELQVEIGLA